MKTTVPQIAWAAVLLIIVGCSTGPKTEGPAPGAADRAASAVDVLAKTYEARDVSGFMALVSARYLGGYGDLETELRALLASASSVDLEIVPGRVRETEGSRVLVDVRWTKAIARGSPSRTETTSGSVTLVFIRYTPEVLKLFAQEGEPVFP